MADDPFNRDPTVTYGEPVRLYPGLRRVTCPNPSPMTFSGTQTYIVGEGAVAVVDPGPADPKHLDAILAALGPDERVSHVVVTHTHIDHSPNARPLADRTGAPTVGFGKHGEAMSARMKTLAASGAKLGGTEGGDNDFTPDIRLGDGETLEGEGWKLTARHTPGHVSNHIALEVEAPGVAPGVMLSGDHVMGWATSIVSPPDGDMAAFMASLRKLQGRGYTRFFPGHGHPIEDPEALIAWMIRHREGREAQIMAALPADGPGEAVEALTHVIYTDVDPALMGAAARNVFSHLLGLVEEGRAVHDGPLAPESRFRKV